VPNRPRRDARRVLPLLELHDVEARYGEIRALHGVTLNVDDGDFVAILGANGAGKTTTLRAISGMVKTSGEVIFEGSKLFHRTPEGMARRGVAHVPEGRGTFATLSVLDNLRLGAWTQRGTSQRDLAHVFELFPQLYQRRAQRAGALSGGEQQMLALGRAMMAKPRLLLLDEPSLGLSPAAVRELFDALQRLNESGMTIVVVEQNAALALGFAKHAFVLETGRIVLGGEAADLSVDESVRRSFLGY
jgi:branched-chain amino acid transport system ATP-binding protein